MSVLITVTDDRWAEVLSPYGAKDVIKSLPAGCRKWDKPRSRWLVLTVAVDVLAERLKEAGFTVAVVRQQEHRQQEHRYANGREAPGTWADLLFCELPGSLADRAYSALARVLHPDAGGDARLMTALNVARDKARGRK